MNTIPKHRMTVEQYFAWAERRPGRHELVDGAVHEMSPQTPPGMEIAVADVYGPPAV